MTFMEKMVLKANKAVLDKARKENKLNEVIKNIMEKQGTEGLQYGLENGLITEEEVTKAMEK